MLRQTVVTEDYNRSNSVSKFHISFHLQSRETKHKLESTKSVQNGSLVKHNYLDIFFDTNVNEDRVVEVQTNRLAEYFFLNKISRYSDRG